MSVRSVAASPAAADALSPSASLRAESPAQFSESREPASEEAATLEQLLSPEAAAKQLAPERAVIGQAIDASLPPITIRVRFDTGAVKTLTLPAASMTEDLTRALYKLTGVLAGANVSHIVPCFRMQ